MRRPLPVGRERKFCFIRRRVQLGSVAPPTDRLIGFCPGIRTYTRAPKASMAEIIQRPESSKGDEILLGDTAVLTRLDKAIGWARKFSIFPYPFATACCAMEYMPLSCTPYDIDRFGAVLPRFT